MKHLKYIKEMGDWATPNRLGYIKGAHYNEITEETVKRSLTEGPPMLVKIAPSSCYYVQGDRSNPIDVVGTIIVFLEGRSDHKVSVRWKDENGPTNQYRYEDLEISY